MRQGVRGMEQIKNRCLYTCDSAFQKRSTDGAVSARGARSFLPLSLSAFELDIRSFYIPLGDDKHAAVWLKSQLLSHFLTHEVINMQHGLMLIHLETTQPLSPGDHDFPSSLIIGEKFQRHDTKQGNLLVITLFFSLVKHRFTDLIYQECMRFIVSLSLLTNDAQP